MEEIHVAEKVVNERAGGVVVNFVGRANLLDPALVHYHNAIGHFQRFFLIVRHEDAGDVNFVMQLSQPTAQLQPDFGVERTERFI